LAYRDFNEVEETYQEGAAKGVGHEVVVLDGLLTPTALAELRRFCLESTIWHGAREGQGYLGSYMQHGFASGLLLQIAEELKQRLPRIFRNTSLVQMWAYSYDPEHRGIALHADAAVINVNFWITPDEANLEYRGTGGSEKGRGGLYVHRVQAPPGMAFEEFNAGDLELGIEVDGFEQARERSKGKRLLPPLNVPYKANRANPTYTLDLTLTLTLTLTLH